MQINEHRYNSVRHGECPDVQIATFSAVDDRATFEEDMVTTSNVVREASAMMIYLTSGERVEAEIAGATPDYGLAVVRFEGSTDLPPPFPVGNSNDLKIGQFAYAIGSKFSRLGWQAGRVLALTIVYASP